MTSPTATAAWPALDRFDEAALDYGWLKEEGEGAEDAGLAEYEAAKAALIAEHRAALERAEKAEHALDEVHETALRQIDAKLAGELRVSELQAALRAAEAERDGLAKAHEEDRRYITELARRQCTALLEDPEGRSHSCHYLEREAAALAALKPFAALADEIEKMSRQSGIPTHDWAKVCVWDDLLRARAALQSTSAKEGE